jgi:DNA-binding transcriptional LysR family regulator
MRWALPNPALHRAVAELEQEAGRRLFLRTPAGLVSTRGCQELATAVRLALAELDRAEADLAEFAGRDGGRVVIGALPLSRSVLLPEALIQFRRLRPTQPVRVYDGRYSDLLQGLLRGEIDVLLGAVRAPPPVPEVVEEPLFLDRLVVLARPDHPLTRALHLTPADLARRSWVVPRHGTPAGAHFDAMFTAQGLSPPASIALSARSLPAAGRPGLRCRGCDANEG